MDGKNLTQVLARKSAALEYDDLPQEAHELARQCILDYFGVAVAGAGDELVRLLLDELTEAGGATQASVIGHQSRLPALSAALVNGAAGHALDYDDVNMAMPGHPSVAILPGLLALAELKRSSGREVITAFVAGYETACRIGAALQPGHYNLGFHSTGTVGAFGAAAACARLLGLDAEATAMALGIAGTQAAGLKSQFGTMCKPFHAGKAAQNGLLAARLAARGFSSRADIIEGIQGFALTHGPDFSPEAALATPEVGLHLFANLFKYHAACYLTHAPIECARRLREQHRLTPRRSSGSPCGSMRAASGSATSRLPSMGCRANSACARPSRWHWLGSIRRASAPIAPRMRATRPSWDCGSGSRSSGRTGGRRP